MTPAADTRPPACGHAQPDRYPQQRDTPTAPGYASVFRGRAEEAARVRREIAAYLENCPAVDDMVLIASEMAVNAVMHTRSRGTTSVSVASCAPGPPGSKSKTSAARGGSGAVPATGPTGSTSSRPSPGQKDGEPSPTAPGDASPGHG